VKCACGRRRAEARIGVQYGQHEAHEALESRYGVGYNGVARATPPKRPESERGPAYFSMKVGRYWRLQADAPFCGHYPGVALDELVEACAYVHGWYSPGASGSGRPKSGALIVARQTPACWVLYTFGATGNVAYVVVDEDLGEVWIINVDEIVSVSCAIRGDADGVKELLDQTATAKKIALIGVKESEASVVNVL